MYQSPNSNYGIGINSHVNVSELVIIHVSQAKVFLTLEFHQQTDVRRDDVTWSLTGFSELRRDNCTRVRQLSLGPVSVHDWRILNLEFQGEKDMIAQLRCKFPG